MKTKILIIILLTGLFLSSCRPLYIPNAVHTPMISEKNEFNGAALLGTSGVDVQAAFSPVKHFAVMADASWYDDRKSDPESNHYHFFAEGGTGYYNRVGLGHFDIYTGGGFGNVSTTNTISSITTTSTGTYYRIFLQPCVGLGTKAFDASFTLRTAYVNFTQVTNPTISGSRQSSLFAEPVFTLRVGYKWVKYFFQAGFSFPMQKELMIDYQPFMISTGINLNFGNKF